MDKKVDSGQLKVFIFPHFPLSTFNFALLRNAAEPWWLAAEALGKISSVYRFFNVS